MKSYWPNTLSWCCYWPVGIVTLIAVIQLVVSFAILFLHIAFVVIGVAGLCLTLTSWYVIGFICWLFFLACWISIFCVNCCHRSSIYCATYTMMKNILAFIFSCVLINFDQRIIIAFAPDFLNIKYSTGCVGFSMNDSSRSYTDWFEVLRSITKGQLAASVIMLVSTLVFVGIYIYVYIKAVRNDRDIKNNTVHLDTIPAQTQTPIRAMPQSQSPKYQE